MRFKRPLFLVLSFAPCLAMALSARAEYEPSPCQGFFSDNPTGAQIDLALAALNKCQRTFMGVVAIEQRAAAGESVVRAFIQRGERQLPLFVEYVHSPEGRTWLDVRTIVESRPKYVVPVPEASFSAVQVQWLRRGLPSVSARVQYDLKHVTKTKEAVETVCIPSWGATIEVAKEGRTESVKLDSCKPSEFQFIHFLLAQAAIDSGECAAGHAVGSEDDRLQACLLRGHAHPGLH